MAMSIDALLAIVLFIALVAFISVEPISQMPVTQQKISANQLVDDAISAMDNTGFLMETIESGNGIPIETKLVELLPDNVGFRLEMQQYESNLDDPGSDCRDSVIGQTFATCFPDAPTEFFSSGASVPDDKEVFSGRKIFIKKEPGDCSVEGGLSPKEREFSMLFQGNYAPEARDVNITTADSCPGERHPCPATDDTIRCCYTYYDGDSDPIQSAEFKWYKYNSLGGDHPWEIIAGEVGETLVLDETYDGERVMCDVRVSDGSNPEDWSQDSNSPLAVVGGPCFEFDSNVTQEGTLIDNFKCGETYKVEFAISAEVGSRDTAVDIMLSMDRSGSMSWGGIEQSAYSSSDTPRSIFVDESAAPDRAYLGTDNHVYTFDVNNIDGSFNAIASTTEVDDAYAIYVDGSYVYVADGDAGLTVLDKSDLSKLATIGEAGQATEMTTARGLFVEGDYIYVAAAGTYSEAGGKKYGAEMDSARTIGEEEYIGYSSDRSWAVQEFSVSLQDINGAEIEVRKVGNPGDLTVEIRSTMTGAPLTRGSATIGAGSISTSWETWLDVDFPGEAVDVTPGQTYYLALTTTGTSSSDYYEWGSRKSWSNPYSNGSLYRCTSGGSCESQNDTEWGGDGYEDARFKIYNYSSIVGGLVVIDKSDGNPTNWSIISNLYNTGSGYIDRPQDVVVSGSYAFLTDKSGGDGTEGLWVIDVSTPEDPSMTGFESTSNAYHVAVLGNYALVSDRTDGLHILDVTTKSNPSPISGSPLTTLGTVDEVELYDTNAYVTADTGSGATGYGTHVIDMSSPTSPTVLDTYYTQFAYVGADSYGLFAGQKYLFLNYGYNESFVTLNRIFGTKIDISKNNAKEFVLFEDWDVPQDKLGVASYGNDNSTLDHDLVDASPANKASVVSAIDTLIAYMTTPMNLGLEEAIDELTGIRGRAEAIQFMILLADGQSDTGTQDDINAQVDRAETNEIYIFTIGIGGDVSHWQMERIAEEAYCPNLGDGDCGSYHHIDDPEALSEVYTLIAGRIAEISGRLPDRDTADITMRFDGLTGMQLSNFSPAPTSWANGILDYNLIDIRNPWSGSFEVTIPCDYEGCGDEFIDSSVLKFPADDSAVFFDMEGAEQPAIQWPEKFKADHEFYFNDLAIEFVTGQFHGVDDTSITYTVSNVGYEDNIDLGQIVPTVNFNESDNPLIACDGTNILFENFSEILDAAYGEYSGPGTTVEKSSEVPGSGYICMWLNPDQNPIVECEENNKVIVHCAIPKTFVYVLDYWAWEK